MVNCLHTGSQPCQLLAARRALVADVAFVLGFCCKPCASCHPEVAFAAGATHAPLSGFGSVCEQDLKEKAVPERDKFVCVKVGSLQEGQCEQSANLGSVF